MAEQTLDLAVFRLQFPLFADPAAFPDAYIQAQWDAAAVQISPWDGAFMSGARLQRALNLLTAHLMQINLNMSTGGAGGVMQSASIDKVAVAMVAPPARSGWQYWLASTPYGLQLWAFLKAIAGPGYFLGGLPERAAFRKVGGLF